MFDEKKTKVNKTITLNLEDYDYLVTKGNVKNMSKFISDYLANEVQKLKWAESGEIIMDPITGEITQKPPVKEEPIPETPEQTWLRIKDVVELARENVKEAQIENPKFTIEEAWCFLDWAKSCDLSRDEFKKWVNGEYSEIEMKANIMEK